MTIHPSGWTLARVNLHLDFDLDSDLDLVLYQYCCSTLVLLDLVEHRVPVRGQLLAPPDDPALHRPVDPAEGSVQGAVVDGQVENVRGPAEALEGRHHEEEAEGDGDGEEWVHGQDAAEGGQDGRREGGRGQGWLGPPAVQVQSGHVGQSGQADAGGLRRRRQRRPGGPPRRRRSPRPPVEGRGEVDQPRPGEARPVGPRADHPAEGRRAASSPAAASAAARRRRRSRAGTPFPGT